MIYLFNNKIGRKIKHLDLKLICYSGKKALPAAGEKDLTAFEINGGVSMSTDHETSILVYRKEEIVKVLTHEMIHGFGLDHKYIPEHLEDFANKYFKVVCRSVTINESFTDALACLINAVIYTHLSRPSNFERAFRENIKIETAHIVAQAKKVLLYNGYYVKNGVLENDKNVCEQTHVTSYYVLKAVVYYDLDMFLAMLKKSWMCIDLDAYLQILKTKMHTFVKDLDLDANRENSKNLKMSSLDILRTLKTI